MNRQQTVIVVVAVLVVLGLIAVTAKLGGSQRGPLGSGASSRTLTTRAKRPGRTFRPIKRAASAEQNAPPAKPSSANASSPDKPADLPRDPLARETAELLRKAAAAETPKVAIAMLEHQLANAAAPMQAMRIYEVLGTLHLRSEPPDFEQATLAATALRELAVFPEDACNASGLAVQVWLAQDQPERALEEIQQTLEVYDDGNLPSLRLLAQKGNILHQTGDSAKAEEAFTQLMDTAGAHADALGPEALDLYRLAALRLSKLYRESGRQEDCTRIERLVKAKLGE